MATVHSVNITIGAETPQEATIAVSLRKGATHYRCFLQLGAGDPGDDGTFGGSLTEPLRAP